MFCNKNNNKYLSDTKEAAISASEVLSKRFREEMTLEKDGFKVVSRDYLGREVETSISGSGNTTLNAESNEGKIPKFIATEARKHREEKKWPMLELLEHLVCAHYPILMNLSEGN